MARVARMSLVLNFFLFSSLILCYFTSTASANIELDEDNWKQVLTGEWMIEFYAPWCPACNALTPAWNELSNKAQNKKLPIKVASVDVTQKPGLSGRFGVTALPTIYHVKDTEFRQYKGPRDAVAMLEFVEKSRWKQIDAIPSWKAPDSIQMGLVASFFRLSQALRSIHHMLMETYGLPTWGSYILFALATIVIGAVLGLILVCVIDLLYPVRRSDKVFVPQAEVDRMRDDKKSDDELINDDDIVDDAENAPDSDAEKNSPSDTSDDEKAKDKGAGEGEGAGEGGQCDKQDVRKRRPRKAD